MTDTSVQWYQSVSHVTASILKPKGREKEKINVQFGARRCEMFINGISHWRCVLADDVIPEKCRYNNGPKRVEIKMKKHADYKWPTYEAVEEFDDCAMIIDECNITSNSDPDQNVEMKMEIDETSDVCDKEEVMEGLDVGDQNVRPTVQQSNTVVQPDDMQSIESKFEETLSISDQPSGVSSNTGFNPTDDERDILAKLNEPGRVVTKGRTGLVNLGNTCFMNSIMQCISHTTELRNYFITNRYRTDMNKANPLGCQGKLSLGFASLVKALWDGEKEYLRPVHFRHLVMTKFSEFSNLNQHDAQEFLSFFMDKLHEDLNRIKKKPTTDPVDSKGQPDMKVASESWRRYKLRNDSQIEDLFLGQFKSTLVCSSCEETSVVFDPFLSISVPLPKKMLAREVLFLPQNPDRIPIRYLLHLPEDAKMELLKASVARRTELSMTKLRVFEVHKGKFQTLMSANRIHVARILPTDTVIVCEVLSDLQIRKPVIEIPTMQRLVVPKVSERCNLASCNKKLDKQRKCSACLQVAYCGVDCQRSDWTSHKNECELYRTGRKCRNPQPVGCPFVLSLLEEECKFERISKMAETYAKRSVDVTVVDNSFTGDDNEMDEENPVNQKKPFVPFTFSLVSRFGETKKANLKPEDFKPSDLRHNFLSLDWQNNSKLLKFVMVNEKPVDCVNDASASHHRPNSDAQPITLEDCLELFTEPETLTENDSWYCPECKVHREATKQMSLWRLPKVLVIHLKRFSYQNFILRGKIDKFVKFPINSLDLRPYILGEAVESMVFSDAYKYDLYGVVNHHGYASYGHYTANIKSEDCKDNEWLLFDDEYISTVKEERIQTRDAYLLFYKRTQA